MFIFSYLFQINYSFLNIFFILTLLYFLFLLITHIKRGLFSVLYDYIKMPYSYEFLNLELTFLLVLFFLEFFLYKNSIY